VTILAILAILAMAECVWTIRVCHESNAECESLVKRQSFPMMTTRRHASLGKRRKERARALDNGEKIRHTCETTVHAKTTPFPNGKKKEDNVDQPYHETVSRARRSLLFF